jgi:YHS domain-containing protein
MKDSSAVSGPKLLDPVCDMIVAVDDARENGLTLEMPDREYAFCSPGCMSTFAKAPQRFRAKVDAWVAANPAR